MKFVVEVLRGGLFTTISVSSKLRNLELQLILVAGPNVMNKTQLHIHMCKSSFSVVFFGKDNREQNAWQLFVL